MMEEYVAQSEKAISTGKREDLAIRLITKLEIQKRDRQYKTLGKTGYPPKVAETAANMPNVTTASGSTSRRAVE